jgi:hypothetical protein
MPDNHYVHLKDEVVFAHHQTDGTIETSDTVIAVSGDDAPYVNHTYDADSGTFTPAEEIRYAILDSNNTVVQILSTYFQSEVGTNPVITDPSVQVLWTWDGSNFNAPGTVSQHPVLQIGEMSVTTSSAIQGLSGDQLAIEMSAEQARKEQYAQQQAAIAAANTPAALQAAQAARESIQATLSLQLAQAIQENAVVLQVLQGTQGL